MLEGLAPVVDPQTRVLVLGSFPGVKSLQLQQYYAHPQNAFWRIATSLLGTDFLAQAYALRLQNLLAGGLGLWDVYASCERVGSLDSAIKNPVPNDFLSVKRTCPKLALVVHNGAESGKHAKHTALMGLRVLQLPSTSPANASWSFDRKLAAWQKAISPYLR
jgi:double-stranded uracil-DNA glycosylase